MRQAFRLEAKDENAAAFVFECSRTVPRDRIDEKSLPEPIATVRTRQINSLLNGGESPSAAAIAHSYALPGPRPATTSIGDTISPLTASAHAALLQFIDQDSTLKDGTVILAFKSPFDITHWLAKDAREADRRERTRSDKS